jgi:hypothetical protein
LINQNGWRSFPIRCWQKKGDPVSKSPISTIKAINGDKSTIPMVENKTSKNLVILSSSRFEGL